MLAPQAINSIPTDCKEEDIECHFPDLADKHPDCSRISDGQLVSLTMNKWESTTIPYSISETEPNWVDSINTVNGFKDLHAAPIDTEIRDAVERSIALAFDKFTALTNGKFKFQKKNTFQNRTPFFSDVFSRGITFMLPASERVIADTTNAGGFTLIRMNNNGYLRDTAIYLPNDRHYWHFDPINYLHYAWLHQTISHEIEHALGILDWTPKVYMLDRLSQIQDGVYCSVMPYPNLISTPISSCNVSTLTCDPPYAIFPASLDKRWFDLVYERQFWQAPDYSIGQMPDQPKENFNLNSNELIKFAFFFTLWHQILLSLLTGYASKTGHQERNTKLANLIADSALMVTMVACEMPWEAELIFGMTSLNKYIPDRMLSNIQPAVKWAATTSYNNFSTIMYAIAANGMRYTGFRTISLSLLAMMLAFVPKIITSISISLQGRNVAHADTLAVDTQNVAASEPGNAVIEADYQRMEDGRPTTAGSASERVSPKLLQWMPTSPRQPTQQELKSNDERLSFSPK
jgi:hypothetical protein